MHKKLQLNNGFTLIELMVSVAIFSIVMLMSVSSLFSALDLNRRAQAMKLVVNNLNFALESIGRAVRTGTNFSGGGDSFTFHNQRGETITFFLDTSNPLKRQIMRTSGGITTALTAEEVYIENNDNPFSPIPLFTLRGEATDDEKQPLLIVRIKGRAGVAKAETHFNIQTTISERVLDVP